METISLKTVLRTILLGKVTNMFYLYAVYTTLCFLGQSSCIMDKDRFDGYWAYEQAEQSFNTKENILTGKELIMI